MTNVVAARRLLELRAHPQRLAEHPPRRFWRPRPWSVLTRVETGSRCPK